MTVSGKQPFEVILEMLRMMVDRKASDLFISVGFPPAMKVDGQVTPISEHVFNELETKAFARALMSDKQLASFEATKECNFAIAPAGIGRFRASAYFDQNGAGLVLRTINTKIPTLDELGLPPILKDVAMSARGLVMDLSLNVRAFLSQRLVPCESGKGRVAAFEIMLDSPLIKDMIFKGEVHQIKDLMTRSVELGMQTFDKALFDLYQARIISYESALRFADSANDLRLHIKLEPGGRKPERSGDASDLQVM